MDLLARTHFVLGQNGSLHDLAKAFRNFALAHALFYMYEWQDAGLEAYPHLIQIAPSLAIGLSHPAVDSELELSFLFQHGPDNPVRVVSANRSSHAKFALDLIQRAQEALRAPLQTAVPECAGPLRTLHRNELLLLLSIFHLESARAKDGYISTMPEYYGFEDPGSADFSSCLKALFKLVSLSYFKL